MRLPWGITKQRRPGLDDLEEAIACQGLSHEWKERLKKRREFLKSAID